MKIKEYISENYEGKIFTKEFCLFDMLKGIKDLDKQTVRELCIEFLEMMVKDLVDENDYFLFPIHKFAYVFIENIGNMNSPCYEYKIEKDGHVVYEPVIVGNGILNIRTRTKYIYLVRFLGKTREYFESVINKGHHY